MYSSIPPSVEKEEQKLLEETVVRECCPETVRRIKESGAQVVSRVCACEREGVVGGNNDDMAHCYSALHLPFVFRGHCGISIPLLMLTRFEHYSERYTLKPMLSPTATCTEL